MRSRLPVWLLIALLLVGGLWATWLGTRHLDGTASILDRAETVLLDLRIQIKGEREPPDDVVIVAIDDETLAHSNSYPIDRADLARLLDKVREAGAKAMGIDVLLLGASDQKSDTALAKALASLPTVIAGAAQFKTDNWYSGYVPAPDSVLRPLPALAKSAAIGLVNVATDSGGTPRQIPMIFKTAVGPEPSLALRAVDLYLDTAPTLASEGLRFATHEQPLDLGWHLPLNYYGPAGTIHTVSAQSLFDGSGLNPEIAGKLVLVGVTATGVGDRFGTPFDQILPGVEVLATGASNLLDGSALIRDTSIRTIDMIAAIAITLIGMLTVALLPLATASILFILIISGWLVATSIAFASNYWLSGALPLAASIPPVIALAIIRQIFVRYAMLQLERAKAALSRFQSPAVARRIAEDPSFLRTPTEQQAAILFIDLAGYTGLSERLGPVKTRDMLKAFHTIVVNETSKHSGLVMDFMGDGAMIAFGIPDATNKDAENAVNAAFDLANAVSDWIAQSGLSQDVSNVRVGGHFGTVVLSRLGHENQQQIAATGDCVNVASRLQDVGKSHQASIVLSDDLFTAAQQTRMVSRTPPRTETVAIRGRQKDLDVALWTAAQAANRGG